MKVCILMGSPRINGNTAELCKPFITELEKNAVETVYIPLYGKNISSCKGCYACQQVSGIYGCVQYDDMQEIVSEIITSDVIVFATPIYTWFCPPEMKAVLDRHYGMNKFYGKGTGSLWEGKRVAILATHGYDSSYGAEPFETGIKRLCKHSKLRYIGMYSVRDENDLASFQTEEAMNGAKVFAVKIIETRDEYGL